MHRSTIYILLLAVCIINECTGEATVQDSQTCEEKCDETCEKECDEPNKCTDEEKECGTEEQVTTGTRKYCTPHQICVAKNCDCPTTGSDQKPCPKTCQIECTEEELHCAGQTDSRACKEPDQCVAKGTDPDGVACPGYCHNGCDKDHIECPVPNDARGCPVAPACIPIEKGTNGVDCPTSCPVVCPEKELLCVGKVDDNACKEADTCVAKDEKKDGGLCPGSCPVECKDDSEILCVGPTEADGCKQADTCRTKAKDANGEYCLATSASHECPVICNWEEEYLCPGIDNSIGCKGEEVCTKKAKDNKDPPEDCPADSVCHKSCKVNEVACPGGQTESGCKKPDVCIPRKPNYNGELCPVHCPMDCANDHIKCDGKKDNDGCEEPDFCVPIVPIPIPEKVGNCPAYCPAECKGEHQIKCGSQKDCDQCDTEEVCRTRAKNVNGESCPDNSASHNCPKICDEAAGEVLCLAHEDHLGCKGEDTCMMRVKYGDEGNYCPSHSVCSKQCKSNEILCTDGYDLNGCKNEDICIKKGEDLDGKACEIQCPPICTDNQVLCAGPIKGNGCKDMDTCVDKVIGTGDGAYCKTICPIACTATEVYVPGGYDANGCPEVGICAAPKTFGAWTNTGSCAGATANPHCGPGTQSQTRTCTHGTIDKCVPADTSRVVSCATAGTSLPVCDCSCSDFVNPNGYGKCEKENAQYDGEFSCYVNHTPDQPSTCKDLIQSTTNPELQQSAEACEYENTAEWVPIMQIGEDSTFGYSSSYWIDDQLLNENSAITDEVNAKYAAFLNEPFQAIRMCVGSYASNCVHYTFNDDKTWSSAKELFTAGYIRDSDLDRDRILQVYGPEAGSYQDCGMQRPGFNIECPQNNKARWGYCNNCASQNCQETDDDDADSTIGIGLNGQSNPNEMGAGWTNYFASGAGTCTATSMTYKRVWVSVRKLKVEKAFGDWANDGACVASGDDASCGPGEQKQKRTCTDGTVDQCSDTDVTEQTISCKDADTALPDCPVTTADDAGTADAGTADTGTADAGTADAGTADTGTADAGTADAGTADTGTADTAIPTPVG